MVDTPGLLVVKDGATVSAPQNIGGTRDSSNTFYAAHSLRVDGNAVGAATPLPTTASGTIGVDRSANAPTGPGAATSFVFNGATLNLLGAIAANPSRKAVEINNTTGALVVIVIDDGANTAGSVSIFPLAAGAGAFQQGADFSPPNELGRLRIFGATGTYCYARET